MLIPAPGHKFLISDFSAIEARVIAWLANEKWRLDVFNTHGKIYEASAAAMFGIPLEQITKGSEYRAKGKIAELALGYQGAVGALTQMGGEAMGLSADEMRSIVTRWRKANPAIVQLWEAVEAAALQAMVAGQSKTHGLEFYRTKETLEILLPSGRPLVYRDPLIRGGSLTYMGQHQQSKAWIRLDTYGGKLVENIVQAIARDIMQEALTNADAAGFKIVMHVHDELVCEQPEAGAQFDLQELTKIMGQPLTWAPGLPLAADGFICDFYQKD